jgi:hypothetical protein
MTGSYARRYSTGVLYAWGKQVSDSTPVHLLEDGDNGRRFLIYSSSTGVNLEILYSGEALWMTKRKPPTCSALP